MMNQTAEFNYMETDDFQCLELPYVNDELSMIVLLPRKADGLSGLEEKLVPEKFSGWLSELGKRKVTVYMPKFKMTSQFGLADVLRSMGMTDAFTDKADFSGMNGKRDLFISAVVHKAYVDVYEEGTEAAAATGVVVGLTAVMPSQIPVFRANHPFLFLIRDNKTGSILFIGRVMNPSA
jgi:serpin B